MQFRMSPGGKVSKSRRNRPELPPSSLTVTIAAISSCTRAVSPSCIPCAYRFRPESKLRDRSPPPIETTHIGRTKSPLLCSVILVKGVTLVARRGESEMNGCRACTLRGTEVCSGIHDVHELSRLRGGPSAAFLRLLFFFLVNGNRVQVLGFEDLVAIEASDVIDTVATIKKLGSLVLTSLHGELNLF